MGYGTVQLWYIPGILLLIPIGGVGDRYGIRMGMLMLLPLYLLGFGILASAGRFVASDIARVRLASMTQAEARKARMEGDPKILICRNVSVAYDQVQVLFNVDFEVHDGEIIALLGTNGAGKSTLLKAISGLVEPIDGAIIFDGRDITSTDAADTTTMGAVQVPGGRGIFPSLTVEENLKVACWMYRRDADYVKDAIEKVLGYFPQLKDRWNTPAGNLSGGEQQMLSLSQAFVARPKLLLIDELSLGLAPTIVQRLLDIVRAIHDNGTAVVLVEQSVTVALKLAKKAVFMEKGEIRFTGPTEELLQRPDILRAVFLKGAASVEEPKENGRKVNGDAGRATVQLLEREQHRRNSLKDAPVILETLDITKRYGGVTAVDQVSIQVKEGEILGLIGPNGAG
ncbi:MAG: ATP-binding cassette domain-containing protein, partial [Acidimicrobiia bacterium]